MIKKILLLLLLIFNYSFASQVKIINSGEEALKIRLALMENAKESIDLSYFIFADDEVSHLVLAKLREAQRRGVKVRMIIDHLFNDIPTYVSTHLQKEGIEIKEYNRVNIFKFFHLTRRSHDKMFIVDNEYAIFGGRNIENTYYDLSDGKKNYDDRDILIQGEVVADFTKYFDEIWNGKHLKRDKIKKRIRSKKRKRKYANAIKLLDKALDHKFNTEKEAFRLEELPYIDIEDEIIKLSHDKVQLVKDREEGTANEMYELINNAKEFVLIDSPYFILTPRSREVFKNAIARGVKIRLITNSLKATDGILPQAAYIGQRKKIVEMGIEVYEYFGDYSFHSKSMVIDGKIAAVGSFNFDYLSERNNTETMIIVKDEQVAADLTADMETTILESYKLDEKGRPIGFDRRYPGVKGKKIFLTKLVQFLLVPLIKTQL